jgi:flagellar biosynthesis/type III secretory pathway M-ring protein FliF/YscJ
MKTIIAVIVFGLIIIAIVIMVIINFSYKGLRKIKEEAEENYYRNQKLKEQKEKNPFGDDYFKSASVPKTKPKAKVKNEKQEHPQPEKQERPQERQRPEPEENTARSQTTSSGVTIIDDRDSGDKRKIFDHSDGEYVEFEEV